MIGLWVASWSVVDGWLLAVLDQLIDQTARLVGSVLDPTRPKAQVKDNAVAIQISYSKGDLSQGET